MAIKKKTVLVDMDGVLADFDGAIRSGIRPDPPEMFVEGFYRNLHVLPHAKWAICELLKIEALDLYIGTKHTTKTDFCVSEKVGWIREHFPPLLGKMAMVSDKVTLLRGHYLIDDDKRWAKFKGKFMHFDQLAPTRSWIEIVDYFQDKYVKV